MDNCSFTHPVPPTSQRGFTLVELLIAVSVLAILLGIAVPSFQGMVAANQLTSRTNDFIGAIHLARAEAIRRGVRVTLCRSSNGSDCATSGDWEQGWITFVDTTRSGTSAVVDSGEQVLQVYQGSGGPVSIKGNANVASYISFASDGRPRLMNGTSQTGTLSVCSSSASLSNDARARTIDMTATGRVNTTTPSGIASSCPTPS